MAGDSSRSGTRARHAHEQAAAESAGGSSGGSSCGDEEEKGDKTIIHPSALVCWRRMRVRCVTAGEAGGRGDRLGQLGA